MSERSYSFSFCAGPHKFFHFFLDLFIFQHLKNRLLVLVFDHEALIEAVAEPLDRGLQALNILSLFLVLSLKPKYLTLKLVLISQVAFVDLLGFVEFFLEWLNSWLEVVHLLRGLLLFYDEGTDKVLVLVRWGKHTGLKSTLFSVSIQSATGEILWFYTFTVWSFEVDIVWIETCNWGARKGCLSFVRLALFLLSDFLLWRESDQVLSRSLFQTNIIFEWLLFFFLLINLVFANVVVYHWC